MKALFALKPFLAVAIIFLSSALCFASEKDADWIEDLNYFAENVPAQHIDFFKKHSQDDFNNSVNILRDEIPQLEDHQIIVRINQLLSMAQDGHSFIGGYHPLIESEFGDGLEFEGVPIRFYSFQEGLYIYAAHKDYTNYLGYKLVAINGIPAQEALEIVSQTFPVESRFAIRNIGPYGLVIPKILHTYGLSSSPNEAKFELEHDGQITSVVFPTISAHPNELLGMVSDLDWVRIDAKKPPYLKNENVAAWHRFSEKENLVYLKLNSFEKKNLALVDEKVLSAIEQANKNKATKLIVDIRHNPGGETGIVNTIAKRLAAATANHEKKLFVIIGNRTFSAAQLLATALEQYTHAIFVGEPTGINVHFFGNARNRIVLPNSELKIFTATSWWQTTNMNDRRKWQAPDIATPLNFQDFIDGKNVALEAITNGLKVQNLETDINNFTSGKLKFETFLENYNAFKNSKFNQYKNTEDEMNTLGYWLIEDNKLTAAKSIFKLNVIAYPNSANAYDSLGEAYLALGEKQNALDSYKSALVLNPNDERVKSIISDIQNN